MTQSIVITGADSGIGLAIARRAVEGGWRVFGGVRSEAGFRSLAGASGGKVTPLLFDVRDEGQTRMAAEQVAAVLGPEGLTALVNNAGIGISGPLLHQPVEEIRAQLDTNLFGAFLATKIFLPLLGADRPPQAPKGRVVVLSSSGGAVGQPFATAYSASTFGLEGFGESLRRELRLIGIPVIVVAPSEVATPIGEAVEAQDIGRFDGTAFGSAFRKGVGAMVTSGEGSLDPSAVAETVLAALTAADPEPRYPSAEHLLPEQVAVRVLPRRWLARVMKGRRGPADAPAGASGDRPARH